MLQVTHIHKRFGAVTALKDVSLSIVPGEIRALLGANGSGKSTLVKILGGMVKKDAGNMTLDDRSINIDSPADSKKKKIAITYQDLSLIARLSVVENIVLGQEPLNQAGFVDERQSTRLAGDILKKLALDIDLRRQVEQVELSQQCFLEVAKALALEPRVLILDEITASLHYEQVQRLFSILREMRTAGCAILFVSHRLDEVFALCDTATVLRNGENVLDTSLDKVTRSDLIYAMTGQRIKEEKALSAAAVQEKQARHSLKVENLHVGQKVKGVSLYARQGEIIGVGGLQGQGQNEFLRAVYGAIPFQQGHIQVEENEVRFKSPAQAVKSGVGFISGDREKEGIFPLRPVIENLFLVKTAQRGLAAIIHTRAQQKEAGQVIQTLKIVAAGVGVPANSLSGGNQQKLAVGRWLLAKPKILLLDDPTKGVDIISRNEIHDLLREMTKAGMAIILSSSDNDELLHVAGRIYVFYEGQVVKELQGADKNEEQLVAAMLGVGRSGGREEQ